MSRTMRRSWSFRPRVLFQALCDRIGLDFLSRSLRTPKSAEPERIQLVLRELERREMPSESLSFLAGGMFFGGRETNPTPPARTAQERTDKDSTDAARAAFETSRNSINLPATSEESGGSSATQVAHGPAPLAAKGTAWADPWGGWYGEDGDAGPVAAPVRSGGHSGDDDAPRGGGGSGAPSDGLAGRVDRPAQFGSPGQMPATPTDPGNVPAATPVKGAATPAAAAAVAHKGLAGGGSGSPFPWVVAPGGAGPLSAIAFGAGTTVFTPAMLLHPSFVVDANKGAVLTEAVINHDFSDWSVDLRAQVSGAPVTGYAWSFNHPGDVAGVTGDTTYNVQFTWDSFTGDPKEEAVTLTTTFAGPVSQAQTFHFLVAATDSPAYSTAPTAVGDWPAVPTPDMVQSGAPVASGPHHTITLADGSVSTSFALPAYNPAVAPVSLNYNSLAADARPIFVDRYELDPTVAVPSTIDARLTVNGTPLATYTYDTHLMNPGDFVQVALQKDATGLSTGRYTYSLAVKANYGSPVTTTTSGSFTLINDNASPYGAGWWVDGLDRIVTGSGGVALVMAGGRSLWFDDAGGGTYTSPAGDFSTLVENGGGDWTRTRTDRSVEQFDTGGKLTTVADANNNTTTYVYTTGKLYTITDPYNQVTTFAYDGNSKLDSITDPAGRVTQITVTSGKLTAAADPASGAWAYGYDGDKKLTSITDPNDWATTFAYDATAKRASTITEADGATETVAPLQVQGIPTGGTTTAILTAAVTANSVDGNSHTWAHRLDWLGLGTSMQMHNPVGDVAVQYRDANGLLWLDSDGLGRRDRYAYDTQGNVTAATWADDAQDQYVYDTGTNPFGDLVSHTNPIGETTTYAYDAKGNLTRTVTPRPLTPGDELQVNTYTSGQQQTSYVASAADGTSVIAWTTGWQDGDGYGVYAQRFDPYGQPLGSEFRVNTHTTSHQMVGGVAMDAAGDFVVVWSGYGQSTDAAAQCPQSRHPRYDG
jgi:YD repeat-containing protein